MCNFVKKIMEIFIGNEIRRVMEEKRIPVARLAEVLEMHSGSVSRLYGYRSIQTDVLQKISVELGVDFFEFYSRDLNFKKEVVAVTSCEKKLEEKTAELEVLKKEMEGFKREMGYLKQINELLVKK